MKLVLTSQTPCWVLGTTTALRSHLRIAEEGAWSRRPLPFIQVTHMSWATAMVSTWAKIVTETQALHPKRSQLNNNKRKLLPSAYPYPGSASSSLLHYFQQLYERKIFISTDVETKAQRSYLLYTGSYSLVKPGFTAKIRTARLTYFSIH